MSNTEFRTKKNSVAKGLFWSVVMILMVLLSFSNVLDDHSNDYTQAGFKRALATFAVARGLNGVISVAQETELVVHPVGVGLTLAPGQILDPVNDMVERFSWIMLASSTSLGVQSVLLEIVSWPVFSLLIAGLGFVWLVLAWGRAPGTELKSLWISRLMILALLIRFSIPVISIASESIYHAFLEDKYTQSVSTLEVTTEEVEKLNTTMDKDSSIVDRAKQWVSKTKDKLAVRERMERYQSVVSEASESTINLIVVFVIQTILLPLFFLWFFFKVIRNLFMGLVSSQ